MMYKRSELYNMLKTNEESQIKKICVDLYNSIDKMDLEETSIEDSDVINVINNFTKSRNFYNKSSKGFSILNNIPCIILLNEFGGIQEIEFILREKAPNNGLYIMHYGISTILDLLSDYEEDPNCGKYKRTYPLLISKKR